MSYEKAYIYILKDPTTSKVRYVGKTVRSLEKRLGEHTRHAKSYTHRCANWVNSLEKKGIKPVIELVEEVSFEAQDEREIHWIKFYRDAGADLTNLTDGGEGTAGYEWSDESKKAKSVQMRGQKMHTAKLTEKDVLAIYGKMRAGVGNQNLAEEYGLTRQSLGRIRAGKDWSHLFAQAGTLPTSRETMAQVKGDSHGASKLTEDNVLEIYELLRKDTPHKVISEKYGINMSTVSNIRSGKKWKHLYDFNNPIPSKKNAASHQGSTTPNARLTEEKVIEIYHLLKAGHTNKEIGEKYGVHPTNISGIKTGRKWAPLFNDATRNPLHPDYPDN